MPVLWLRMFGTLILLRCKYIACKNGIEQFYDPFVCSPSRTADLLVECDWREAGPYLFRARPESEQELLEGVRFQLSGQQVLSNWESRDPPLPPMDLEPFRNRFVGLHGGAVIRKWDGKCLAFAGARSSGKTTLCRELDKLGDYSIIADETLLIHRRSKIAQPFPKATAIRLNAAVEKKKLISASEAFVSLADAPSEISLFLLLERTTKECAGIDKLTALEAGHRILQHQVRAGTSWSEGMLTLLDLVTNVQCYHFRHSDYRELVAGISKVDSLLS